MIQHIKTRIKITPAGFEIISHGKRTNEQNKTPDLFEAPYAYIGHLDDGGLPTNNANQNSFQRLVELNTGCRLSEIATRKGTPDPTMNIFIKGHQVALTLSPHALPNTERTTAKGNPQMWLVWELEPSTPTNPEDDYCPGDDED